MEVGLERIAVTDVESVSVRRTKFILDEALDKLEKEVLETGKAAFSSFHSFDD